MPPRPKSSVLEIEPYVPGRNKAEGVAAPRKLSANESAIGTSEKALEAYHRAADSLHLYPDGRASALRSALAAKFGLEEDSVICGHGSDELIQLLCMAYTGPGDEVLYSRHGFLIYPISAHTAGAKPVVAAERNYRVDIAAVLKTVTDATRIVFIANPNNPTGTYLTRAELRELHAGLAPDVLLVIDAAYAEFADQADYDSGITLAREADNIVVTRTFSKIYGLASLRLGWAYGPHAVIDILDRIRGTFNVSGPAEAAGLAALEDDDFLARAQAHNVTWRAWLEAEIRDLGLDVVPSAANFLLINFPDEPGYRAADADAFLTRRGLLLRRMNAYHLPHSLRLSVGIEDDNRAVVDALRSFMSGERSS